MLDRGKLAKILGLLGSDKTGEILSAARAADALIRNANTSWAEVLKQSAIDDDAHALFKERRLGAENDKLRETVRRLWAENHALREQVARGLAHRILDRVKQSGQALLALASHSRQSHFFPVSSLERFRNNEFRPQRVVIHGLVAAGIALAVGIAAFLSLQDVAMLGGPSIRSGTMSSSGQEAPEAARRSSGLPAEAEWRGSISGRSSSAAMVPLETMPQPPPPEDTVAPVEDSATQLATLPPAVAAPDQTAGEVEAATSGTSPDPAEEPATPPATSPTTTPPPTQSPPYQRLSAAEMAALVTRGDDFVSIGDIV